MIFSSVAIIFPSDYNNKPSRFSIIFCILQSLSVVFISDTSGLFDGWPCLVHYTVPNKNRLQSSFGSRTSDANSPPFVKPNQKSSGRVGWTVEVCEIVNTLAETKRVSSLVLFLRFSVVLMRF